MVNAAQNKSSGNLAARMSGGTEDARDRAPQGEHAVAAGGETVPAHVRPFNRFNVGEIYEILPRLSFLVVTGDEMTREYIRQHRSLFLFSADHHERYVPFAADFGPVNLAAVHGFCEHMRGFWEDPRLQRRHLVFYCEDPVELRTNAAFLLAAFLVCELGATPEEAWAPFGRLGADAFATFRDATFCEQSYHLTIKACLQGLHRSIECGWYDRSSFSLGEYEYLDDPATADMHVVSPKLCAFRGPSEVATRIARGVYTFTPTHYTEVFQEMGVSAVVRLNEPSTYDPAGFTKEGIRHYDLYFDDCTAPNAAVVARFLEICEAERGMVAVHCAAGLGRTGTLIAIYLMRHHGWTASECIGWLRIVRPGSVIGPQQQYLHWAEARYRKEASGEQGPAFEHALSAGESAALGLQVGAAQAARARVLQEGALAGEGEPGGPCACAQAELAGDVPTALLVEPNTLG